MQELFITYFPHPFLWAAGFLAGFGCWAFLSERKKVKTPHPKALKPFRLGVESVLFGGAVIGVCFWALVPQGAGVDRSDLIIFGIFGIAVAGSYFICPFLGFNFIWNSRIYSGAAPFLLLLLMLLFTYMGLRAQFGIG